MLEPGVDYPVVCAMRHLSHELIADFRWVGIGNSQFPSGITIESGEHARATIRDARFFNGDDVAPASAADLIAATPATPSRPLQRPLLLSL